LHSVDIMNRPGFGGGSDSWERIGYACIEEVSG
jgi:hypothetical protein